MICAAADGYGLGRNGTVTNVAENGTDVAVAVGVGVGVGVAVGVGDAVGVGLAVGVAVGVAVAAGVGVPVCAYGSELLLLLQPASTAIATPSARSVLRISSFLLRSV